MCVCVCQLKRLKYFTSKPEVYAAREKNGVYIPRERYLQDEAEKKVPIWPFSFDDDSFTFESFTVSL